MKVNAYNLMILAINSNNQTKKQLLKKAEVFFVTERLDDNQYKEVIDEINKKFPEE